jgi:hypothetical protein
MPCMGPDCDYAREQAKDVTEVVLLMLYKMHRTGNGKLDEPNDRFSFDNKLKCKLLTLMEEIYVSEACNSF